MDTPLSRTNVRCRALSLTLTALAAICTAAAAGAAPFMLVVNGAPTTLDPAPLIENGEVLLPAHVISHTLGIAVLPTKTPGMWVVSAYGKHIYVRANTARYLRSGAEVITSHPPRVQGGEMHVPMPILVDNFDLKVKRPAEDRLEVTSPGGEVLSVRQGTHTDWVRVVIDVSETAAFRWTEEPQTVTVLVAGGAGQGAGAFRKWAFPDPLVPEVMQSPAPEGGTSVVIGHRSPAPVLVFTLADPPRVVLDFPRERPETPGPQKAPEDLEFRREYPWKVHNLTTSRGPTVAYSLTLPTGEGKVQLRPGMATDCVYGRATVGRIVSRFGAYAGLNAGFYAPDGAPLGMLVIDGEWIKEPILGRTALGITQDGSLQMGNVRFAGQIALPGVGNLRIDALNAGHTRTDEAVLYTSRWGRPTAEKPGATRVMLSPAREVLLVNAEGRGMVIPQGGYVLSVVGPRAAQAAKAQVCGIATMHLTTDPPWPGLRHAIGGGPRLVANGRPYITAGTERFQPDVAASAAPRSALGIMPNGDALFLVVDGRQSQYSAGMTLGELAGFLVKLGVKDAMNFDGGGSATLVVNGQVVNRPSDGAQRGVANALLAFHAAPRAAGGQ